MTGQELLSRLQNVRRNGSGWIARCPAHDDRTPSLSVSERDGKTLVHCHAGCEPNSILSALGLTLRDLFAGAAPANGEGQIVAAYDYRDESGRLLYQVVRFEPKDFRQRRSDGKGGWIWNLGNTRRVLFNLPAVIKSPAVLIVEGEKDVNTAASLGLVATCNPHGAGKWRAEYASWLRDKRVVVIADADAPGLAHGRDIARTLLGVAASLRLIEALPGSGVKDLSDFVAKFPDYQTARQLLLAFIQDTPELTAADVARWATVRGGFTLTALGDLLSRPDTPIDYVWEGRLAAGTVSALVGKPKVGKGTLARNLCLAVSRGEDFLGSGTKQGECIYLALEEREQDIRHDFRALGADGSEPILIHSSAAPADGIRAVCELVKERKPRLVVIDPLFRLARIKDEKAYAETYAALGPLIDAARETGTHLTLNHHSGKSLKSDPIDSPLGSTAIGGAVATLIVMKRTEAYRTIQTVQRIGQDMPETVLGFDSETRRLSTEGTRFEAERKQCEESVLEFLKAASDPQTQAQIRDGVEGRTQIVRAALTSLVKAGKLKKSGDGTRGKPFVYEFWFSGSHIYTGTRKPETENEGKMPENTADNSGSQNTEKSFLVPTTKDPEKQGVLDGVGSLLEWEEN